jgi:hypothetical protein
MSGVYQITYRWNNKLTRIQFEAASWALALIKKNEYGTMYGFPCMTLVLVTKRIPKVTVITRPLAR